MTQLALFGAPTTTGPRPTDPCLLVLAEVAYLIDHGHDDGIGAPAIGLRATTVDTCVTNGWITRHHTGDPDTEQGPRRLHITDQGRDVLAAHGRDHLEHVRTRYEGRHQHCRHCAWSHPAHVHQHTTPCTSGCQNGATT